MVVGKPVVCLACRETSYLYAKGVGFHPYIWEMNCQLCHSFALAVDAYKAEHEELYKSLVQLRGQYIQGMNGGVLEKEIIDLAEEFDKELDNRLCQCGGHLSISAKPKCIYCDIEIADSYFHYSDDAPR